MTEYKILINHKFSYYFKNDSNKYKSTEENKQQRQKAKEKAIKKNHFCSFQNTQFGFDFLAIRSKNCATMQFLRAFDFFKTVFTVL